jgi:RNA polymerase sigma factor (sigma-70 family)
MTTTSDFLRHLRTLADRQANDLLSDRQLLERFLHQRSEASFAALVLRHGPMVLSVCRRVLHHAQDAEDAFQATFLILARRAGSIRKPESLSSWLHGVAYHNAECLRAKTVRRTVHERRRIPQPTGDALDDITWRELRLVLDEELGKLPEQYRAPLVLCYLEARTQDEAAHRLGWSKNTFGRRMNRARQLLARRLTRRGLTLPAALMAPLLIDGAASAAMPPLLAANTIRAGMASATGQALVPLVSAQVANLAEGGVASLVTKKASIAAILLVSLLVGVGSLLAYRAAPSRTFAEAPAAPPSQSPPVRSTSKDQDFEIKGRVLGPDDKPFAGARVFLLPNGNAKKVDASAGTRTDEEGRFRFTARSADLGPQGKGVLAATARGFGLDWIDLNTKDKSGEITLRLVADDVPVTGRILDLEGQPVAGATVQVLAVTKRADGKDLTAFVEKLEKYQKDGTPGFPNKSFQPGPLLAWDHFQWKDIRATRLDVPATVTTGEDGRFRLTGFGRERVLDIVIRGSTIALTQLRALTRTGPQEGWIRGQHGLYSCRLDYVAAPCKPIIGTVRDKSTGKPLANMNVWVMQQTFIESKTDSQGRYRIVGAAKGNEYRAGASGVPYFGNRKRNIADTPGVEPITVDFELERGLVVRGRLTDKSTGKPVQGEIHYKAEPDNPHLKDFADGGNGDSVRTSPDGSFALVAIPGPGLLHVQADDANRFVRAEIKGGSFQFHAEARINPSENDPKSMTCDIALEPARVLSGSVVGPDGKPLADVYAAGRWPIFSHDLMMHERLQSDSFDVGGLKAGQPRTLVFLHPDKKLGKVIKLQGDETKPLVVRLEPLDAALTGRILDARGKPWPHLKVTVRTLLGGNAFLDKSYPPEFLWGYSAWMNLESGERRQRIVTVDSALPS